MDSHTPYPFYQPSDPNLLTAYSYGDPQGGSYPDPAELFGQSRPSYPEIEVVDGTEEEEEDESIGNGPHDEMDIDPEFDQMSAIDNIEEFPSSGDDSDISEIYKNRRQSSNKAGKQPAKKKKPAPKRRKSTGRRSSVDVFQDEGRKRRRKNKRKEPTYLQSPEFKRLNGLVTKAWINQDHDTALSYALEAIQLYPEYFPLHATIAEILSEKGRPQDAIGALFTGVQVSRDPDNWWYTVDRIQSMEGDEQGKREKLAWCYSKLLNFDSKDIQAKIGRAQTSLDGGQYRKAKNDSESLLAQDPNNARVVQIYATACVALDEPDTALTTFETFINRCTNGSTPLDSNLTWQTISYYLDILVQLEKHDEALKQFHRLARWMLGRPDEDFWNSYNDDREWDCEPEPRRSKVARFRRNPGDENSYGLGLPLEFRIRLGILRVMNSEQSKSNFEEGLQHLRFLLLSDVDIESVVVENADLFKEAGDCLRETGHHEIALEFYEPILQQSSNLDSRFYFDIAICYQALGRLDDVRAAINHIKYGDDNPLAQIGLAKLYQAKGRLDLMWRIVSQLKRRELHDMIHREGLPLQRPANVAEENESSAALRLQGGNRIIMKLKHIGSKNKRASTRRQAAALRGVIVKAMYDDLKNLEPAMVAGDEFSLQEWLRIATELYLEFSGNSRFFPSEKTKSYLGEAWEERKLQLETVDILNPTKIQYMKPQDWRQIAFDDWTELLSHYGVRLSQQGRTTQSKTVLDTIGLSNVIYPEPERIYIVRIASLRAAVLAGNEEWMLEECRWLCKKYEYATDGFRLPSALCRSLHLTPHYFRGGPEQKFWLRQIRVMDFELLDAEHREKFDFTDNNRARLGNNTFNLKELDPELYSLYGHQMAVGSSPVTALNYYLRAYAMRPNDPMLHLCIGLAYITLSFKRQSINRLNQIQHGLAFITKYYSMRSKQNARYRQEAEFNMGMVYNTLALHHLAVPAYDRCIALSDEAKRVLDSDLEDDRYVEDLAPEAALAKRQILAINGDLEGARKITREHLVL
jgi:general transcription factor 3C polypeptide 3 (transcription factor C subunit 4)